MVEVPFYSGRLRIKSVHRVFAAALAASLVLIVPALSAGQNGWYWRIDPQNRELVATAGEQIKNRFEGMLSLDCFPSGGDGNYPADFPADTCMNYQDGKDNVLLLGDSIAAYSYAGLQQNVSAGVNIMQNTLSGCRLIGWGTRNCKARNADFYDHPDRYHFDTLVLSAYWEEEDVPDIEAAAKFLADHGIKTIIIGPSLRFSHSLPDILPPPRPKPPRSINRRRAYCPVCSISMMQSARSPRPLGLLTSARYHAYAARAPKTPARSSSETGVLSASIPTISCAHRPSMSLRVFTSERHLRRA